MLERKREDLEVRRPGPGAGIWDEAADDAGGGMATVSHGPYAERLPVVNMPVGQVRDRFRDRFDIDPASQAYIDGQPVGDDDTRIQAGQVLVFMRPAGEKGSSRRAGPGGA